MTLSAAERRDLIALLCRVARADGSVAPEERERLKGVLARLGDGAVEAVELDQWLCVGPPKVTNVLSPLARQTFMNEAMGLVAADRNIDPMELWSIRQILQSCFDRLDEL